MHILGVINKKQNARKNKTKHWKKHIAKNAFNDEMLGNRRLRNKNQSDINAEKRIQKAH